MKIAGLQKNSTIDYPGYLSSVIFVCGCNYDCYYCHNRHLLDAEEKVLLEEVLEFLEKRKGLIDGVVITGGEPTLYPELPSFISNIRSMGYMIKLDTNGTNPDMVMNLIEDKLIDYVAVDYKAPFEKYGIIDAVNDDPSIIKDNEDNIRKTIECIMESGISYEIRTTMIPEITEADIMDMAKSFPAFDQFVLQKYRPVPEDSGQTDNRIYYNKDDLNRLAHSIKSYQPNAIVKA